MGTSNATATIQQHCSSSTTGLPPPPPQAPSVIIDDSQPSDLSSQSKPRKNVCPYCNISCTKPSVLDKHIRTHTNERPYPCIPCKIAFKTQSNLYKHCRSRTHALKVESGIDSSSADIVAELGDSFREELATVERVQERIQQANLPPNQQREQQNLAVFHPASAPPQHHQNQRIPPTVVEQPRRENLSVPLVQIEKTEQLHQGEFFL